MSAAAGVDTFNAVLRNVMHKFICRVDDSGNEIMLLSNIKFTLQILVPAVETLVQLSMCKACVVLCVFYL